MAIYWNVYAKPYSCAEEFVSSYSNKRDAWAEIRALEDVYPTDCDGIPCRYYMRQEPARQSRAVRFEVL